MFARKTGTVRRKTRWHSKCQRVGLGCPPASVRHMLYPHCTAFKGRRRLFLQKFGGKRERRAELITTFIYCLMNDYRVRFMMRWHKHKHAHRHTASYARMILFMLCLLCWRVSLMNGIECETTTAATLHM